VDVSEPEIMTPKKELHVIIIGAGKRIVPNMLKVDQKMIR
jgi:hypothetical protein